MVYAFVRIHMDTSLTVDPQTSEGINFYLGYQMRIELTFQVPQTCVLTIGRPTPYGGEGWIRTTAMLLPILQTGAVDRWATSPFGPGGR